MGFYKSIAEYYELIFPLKNEVYDFVFEKSKSISQCKLLEIGCATGNLAIELGKKEIFVTGIDLDEEMIKIAMLKNNNTNVKFKTLDMLDIKEDFKDNYFDIITCLGNTLVHLKNLEEIKQLLRSIKLIIKDKGTLIIQILNYKYIIEQSIKELPIIENELIKFERFYSEQVRDERIIFETRLTIKNTKEIISNEIYLYPIYKDQIEQLLEECGFKNIKFYSNYLKQTYEYSKLPLIIEANS